ncbi:hypothetical protein [Deinococcus sp.]|uniref:hypothetical protein n=1 Tax=Deinococcus sp. TaxID=47478 RepID=UPI003B5A4A02
MPPWDTWFAYLISGTAPPLTFLLAWIPLSLIAPVQAAMDISATQHLEWLDESSSDFLRQAYQELGLT